MVTLDVLMREGRLSGTPAGAYAQPPRIATGNPRTRQVLGYLVANCGTCHNGRGEIAALGPILRYEELLTDADRVAASLAGQPTRWQIPGRTDGSVLVDPQHPDGSALVARMRSRSPSSQMPPLGTVLRDDAAITAVKDWIARDLTPGAAASPR
jgi:mono/diheme cytochrome c family protein